MLSGWTEDGGEAGGYEAWQAAMLQKGQGGSEMVDMACAWVSMGVVGVERDVGGEVELESWEEIACQGRKKGSGAKKKKKRCRGAMAFEIARQG